MRIITLVKDDPTEFILQNDDKLVYYPPRPGIINASEYTQQCLLTQPQKVEPLESAYCHADTKGNCNWSECPQIKDNEPERSGRVCPLPERV